MPKRGQRKRNAPSRAQAPRGRPRQAASRSAIPSSNQFGRVQAPVNFGNRIRFSAGMGLSDMRDMRFQYLAGYIYVGNGTLGKSGDVYYQTPDGTSTITSYVPIMPADATIGASYVTDVWKHFARKKFKRVGVHIVPQSVGCATSTTVDVIVAPRRGAALSPVVKTDTTGQNTATATIGNAGAVQFSVWNGCSLDLTPFIAGGSGPAQNEFNVPSSGSLAGTDDADMSLVAPCGIAISGAAPASTYDAKQLATIYVEVVVDLLDFSGGLTPANPGTRGMKKDCADYHYNHAGCGDASVASKTGKYGEIIHPPSVTEIEAMALRRQRVGDVPLIVVAQDTPTGPDRQRSSSAQRAPQGRP